VCDSVNEAGTAKCNACGFAAVATGAEIQRAREERLGVSPRRTQPATDFAASVHAALAPLPIWRRLIAVVGGALAVGGVVWLKLAFSWASMGISVLAAIAGFLLFGLAYSGVKGKEKQRHAG
jgi:hypothetical protein